ncbi:flavoprotein [Orenia marismortui]|uniref:flavoprotein n=1 Tax=Orenia marismortui TaxID=46469 RepID=UPI00035EE60F|nr:flavoprotein [Orenia marismortui]
MGVEGKRIAFVLTGDDEDIRDELIDTIKSLIELDAKVYLIISELLQDKDTKIERIANKSLLSIVDGERLIVNPEELSLQDSFDMIVVASCNENIIFKVANNIVDDLVSTMVKNQLVNQCPVVLAIKNDNKLEDNSKDIGTLLNSKNIYLLPFGQNNTIGSLLVRTDLLLETIEYGVEGRQLKPVYIEYKGI